MSSLLSASKPNWITILGAVGVSAVTIYVSLRMRRKWRITMEQEEPESYSQTENERSGIRTNSIKEEKSEDLPDNAAADLEDIAVAEASTDMFQLNAAKHSVILQKQKMKALNRRANAIPELLEDSVHIPGIQKVFVKSYGCSHNSSDAEYMMGLLQSYGYGFASSLDQADVCLINSCTVKNPSQDAAVSLIDKAKGLKKPIVVSGCIPQADRNLPGLEGVSVIGVTQIDRIVDVVEQALAGNIVRLLTKKSLPSLDLPKIRRNPLVEIIPLNTGCLGSCTYCKTKHARGKLGSYSPSAILQRLNTAIAEGVQQIWLTSEDTGAYGLDIETNIAELLKLIVEKLPPTVMLRLGMTNPPYMMAHLDTIAKLLKHPQVFEFLHIPVQSGSNSTLKHMVREYTREEFDMTVTKLKTGVPELTIATDIICGFPTETDADHKETLSLIETFKFPVLNISQFYPRPGTPAASMKRLPTQLVKQRSREVTKLFESYSCYEYLKGTIQKVWFSELSDRSDSVVGHTKQYSLLR
ncbi:radical SAM methylthiotransferase, MiaB/RimO family protein [Cardiosporidium cionae]|uniref:Radical SAM methylthiotransferase, MiaB/RimO family protein n=1 Tax=Cardiosporidium cionae TaxID=476202 RepID=A0ABQ7JFS4_9APIC|nr:radical SAM methylthiotransferase, MiaB/RimO family protein [Cardiosporidium cionae]|eukprot:KAF8822861.1 radical SAM methylthiotransferase, MiaB/RimO family protein [Cardiosporidium cionae]